MASASSAIAYADAQPEYYPGDGDDYLFRPGPSKVHQRVDLVAQIDPDDYRDKYQLEYRHQQLDHILAVKKLLQAGGWVYRVKSQVDCLRGKVWAADGHTRHNRPRRSSQPKSG